MTEVPPADRAQEEARFAEAGRLLFARGAEFVLGAARLDQLPAADRPEIAFAGRSNVGKSSLINALAGRRALAKVSGTPGRTQQLNVFAVGEGLTLVDMPGYGFAQAPRGEVKAWTRLVLDYLAGRPNLARVYVLIDARHGLKSTDLPVLDLLDRSGVSYQAVLTKADALAATAATARAAEVAVALARRPAAFPEVVLTSARTGLGIAGLRGAVARLLEERASAH
jgi:GTP-binding protein